MESRLRADLESGLRADVERRKPSKHVQIISQKLVDLFTVGTNEEEEWARMKKQSGHKCARPSDRFN